MGPGGRAGLVEKPKNFWGTTARLFGYMRNRLIGIIAVLVLAIASTVFQIRTPKILGEATTEIFKGVMKGQAEQKLACQLALIQLILTRSNRLS